jgi:hypothetical protein
VLGQDASRAMGQDNNALVPGVRQELLFMAGDKIYMNIRLKQPGVTVTNNGQKTSPAAELFANGGDLTYCLEITLEEKDGAAFESGSGPAPSNSGSLTISRGNVGGFMDFKVTLNVSKTIQFATSTNGGTTYNKIDFDFISIADTEVTRESIYISAPTTHILVREADAPYTILAGPIQL